MSEMRKITAFVPEQLLAQAQACTGVGITETLRIALEQLTRDRFYRGMQELQGKLKFDHSLLKLEDRDLDQFRRKP
jgi:hypothetical protein